MSTTTTKATTASIEKTASIGETTKSTIVGSITLLIENPGKGKNWGPLLRCCAAFGITSIYVVGYDQCDVRGSHGASKHVQLIAFHNHKEAIHSLTNQNFELIGLVTPLPNQNNENDDNYYDTDQDDHNDCSKMIREIFFHLPTEKEVEIVRIASSREDDDVITTKTTTTVSENQELLASSSLLSSSNHNNDNNHNNGNKIYSLNDKSSYPIHNYCDRKRNHDRPHEEEVEESGGEEENGKSINGLKLKNNNNNICLVVDKLKRGLPYSLGQYCASFIHIPHQNYNLSNTIGSMLTLEASVSIIFHELISSGLYIGYKNNNNTNNNHHHHSNNYDQTNHEGQKYHVQRINKGGTDDIKERQQIRVERERKIKELQEQHDEDVSLFFGRTGIDNSNTNEDDEGDY